MMAKAYKCDRCGELYSQPDPTIIIPRKGIMLSVICYGTQNWLSDTQDLCPNCARDFLVWWEHSNISAQYQLDKIISEMNSHEGYDTE